MEKLKNVTLLFVEDDKSLRDVGISTLGKIFKEVIPAEDGVEAYNILQRRMNEIDIIVSDINMPKMTGTDFLVKIRGEGCDKPFIFMTAHTEKDKMDIAIAHKADNYIVKPLNIKVLIEEIEDALE
ncbi:MAG: response regulator [Campylobacterota bacterium]|nr:response regulator [Campylobacterota bacterium]